MLALTTGCGGTSRLATASTVLAYEPASPLFEPLGPGGASAEIVAQAEAPALHERVRQALGLSQSEFARYHIDCQPSSTSAQEFVITTTGPDQPTASHISRMTATLLIQTRRAHQQAQVRKAEALIKRQLRRSSGSDRRALRQRLRDFRSLELTLTGDLSIVA